MVLVVAVGLRLGLGLSEPSIAMVGTYFSIAIVLTILILVAEEDRM